MEDISRLGEAFRADGNRLREKMPAEEPESQDNDIVLDSSSPSQDQAENDVEHGKLHQWIEDNPRVAQHSLPVLEAQCPDGQVQEESAMLQCSRQRPEHVEWMTELGRGEVPVSRDSLKSVRA